MKWCSTCGQFEDQATTAKLWDIYDRIRDGRSNYEPLVFTSDWMQENIHDEEDHDAMMLAMERDMVNRGLCPTCARPNLRGVSEDMVMTDNEAQEMHELWAQEAMERRYGC